MRNYMAAFEHIVLTRFNVKLHDNPISGRGTDPDWLEERFKLFETFCYPSLLGQTNNRFKWIVLFDDMTPEPFRERALSYRKWPNYNPEFVNFAFPEHSICPSGLKSIIQKYVPSNCQFLITTRIDNDDAVSKYFIQKIQSCFRAKNAEGITFPLGLQLYKGRLYLDYSIGNHYISLIEKFRPGSFHTVFMKPHNQLYRAVPVRQVLCRPTWLEVVHGGNIANHARNGLVVSTRTFRNNFALGDIQLANDKLVLLRVRQARFLAFGAPKYLLTKLIDRMKYHGLFRSRR